jgi:SAM-dependent methyltransferase
VKILFYHTLSQFRGDLEALIGLDTLTPKEFHSVLNGRFEDVRSINYEAVFEPSFTDDIPFTESIASELKRFCAGMNMLNLTALSGDVVGHLFEAILPAESKKQLGQYFTEDRIGDLLVAFAMRSPKDSVLDPTCGTGGILMRAYAFLKYLNPKGTHVERLRLLWGNDISDFPVELAAVNLFRQEPSVTSEFPRVIHRDFLDLSVGVPVIMRPARRGSADMIELPLPAMSAIVGNPPYVRRQNIGDWTARPAAYRQKLWRRFRDQIHNHQTDYYVFLFLHALRCLRPGGRLAFITSNAWLEAEYGLELQAALLRSYRIIAILESRSEAWFDKARVNTVITVVERPVDTRPTTARSGPALGPAAMVAPHKVKFVKLKKPLAILAPGTANDPARFDHYVRLVNEVEDARADVETEEFRLRAVTQMDLTAEMPIDARISKWGHYLRAPAAFERVLRERRTSLSDLHDVIAVKFGTLTGWNEFYCPTDSEPGYETFQHVEPEYLAPLVRTIKDARGFRLTKVHCKGNLFVCDEPKAALRGTKAFQHIRWGEHQTNADGERMSETGEMANRNPWYRTRAPVRGDVAFQMFIGNRHFSPANADGYCVTNNMLAGEFRKRSHVEVGWPILNSLWFFLAVELYGRINLGEGALKVEKIDLEVMPIPRMDAVLAAGLAPRLTKAFERMARREPLPIAEEVQAEDRRDLDDAIFEFLGLNEKERRELRESVVELAVEREKVADERRFQQERRQLRDVAIVEDEVRAEILPEGLKPFPEAFLEEGVKTRAFDIPAKGLRVAEAPSIKGQSDLFKGDPVYRLEGDGGYGSTVASPEEAEYIYCSQNGVARKVQIPLDPAHARLAVVEYRKYLHAVENSLFQAIFARSQSAVRATALSRKLLTAAGATTEPLAFPVQRSRRKKPG